MNLERLDARDHHIQSEVGLEAVDEEGTVDVLLDDVGPIALPFRNQLQVLLAVLDEKDALALAAVVRLQNERGRRLAQLVLPFVHVAAVGAELAQLLGHEPGARVEVVFVRVDLAHHVEGPGQGAFLQYRAHV